MKDKEFSKLIARIIAFVKITFRLLRKGDTLGWGTYSEHIYDNPYKEAGQIKCGDRKTSRIFEITPPRIKEIRKKLNLSQSDFALMIGVSISTLQNWEQGRREPDSPAKALLKIASKNPEAVMDALHA